MTVRRVDFWQIKPGGFEAFADAYGELREATSAHANAQNRLMIVNHGYAGPDNLTAGDCYTTVDLPSAAAYGDALKAVNADPAVSEIWSRLHSQDAPVVHRGTGLFRKFHEDGTPLAAAVDSVSLVRAWRIEPGMQSVAQAAGQAVQQHAAGLGGYLQVLRPMIAPSTGANVITSTTFPSWSELGQFLDVLDQDPEIEQATAAFRSATPPGHLLQAHIARCLVA